MPGKEEAPNSDFSQAPPYTCFSCPRQGMALETDIISEAPHVPMSGRHHGSQSPHAEALPVSGVFRGWRREHQPGNHETKPWHFLSSPLSKPCNPLFHSTWLWDRG